MNSRDRHGPNPIRITTMPLVRAGHVTRCQSTWKTLHLFTDMSQFQHYRKLESLTDYLLIAQGSYRVEHYVRQPDGQWLFSEATHIDEMVHLPTVGCDLPLVDVYDKVEVKNEKKGHLLNGYQRK